MVDTNITQAAGSPPIGKVQLRLLLVSVALALLVPALAIVVIYLDYRQAEHEAYTNLEAIAELKAIQVENWLTEREGDAKVAMTYAGLIERVANWQRSIPPSSRVARRVFPAGQSDANEREYIRSRLQTLSETYHYAAIHLVDKQGQPLFTVGEDVTVSPTTRGLLPIAFASGQLQHGELFLNDKGRPSVDYVAPLLRTVKGVQERVGAFVLHADLNRNLLPFIQRWPGNSASGETLLVRREGDSVLYLNELRHQKGTALTLKHPMSMAQLPASIAIQAAKPGTTAGQDYRDIPVLAAYRPVAGTDWHLVAKIDRDEVIAPVRSMAYWAILIALFAFGLVSVLLLQLWRGQKREHRLAMQEQADRLLNNFYDQPFFGMALTSPATGGWLQFNDQMCAMLGYSRAEFAGMTWMDITHPDDLATNLIHIERLANGETESYTADKRYLRKNGSVMYATVSVHCARNPDGTVDYFVVTVHDLTERVQVELQLLESEQRFREILDHAPIGMSVMSMDGRFARINYALCNFLGYEKEELRQLNYQQITVPDDQDASLDEAQHLLDSGASCFQMEKRYLRKDGQIVWGRVTASILKQGNGTPPYFICQIEDITERKRQQDMTHQLLVEQQAILRTAMVGIAYIKRRHVVSCNRRLEELYGWGPSELDGKSTSVFFDTYDNFLAVGERAYAAVAKGGNYTEELMLRRKDGSVFWGALNCCAVDPAQPHEGSIWVYADISERRKAEQESHKLLQAIEQSPVSVLITDLEGRIEYVNACFTRVTGYTRSEVVGKNTRFLKSGETPLETYQELWHKLLGRDEWRGIFRNRRKNGELFWEDATISSVVDYQGQITNFIAVKEDITERKQIEDAQIFLSKCGYQHPDEDFFASLARYLARALDMEYVCIDRLEGDGLKARTVASYLDGEFEDNISYALQDLPCGDVVGKAFCVYLKDVCRLFPKDMALKAMGAESYVGVTLWDSVGKPIGLIAVIGRKPLTNPNLAESLLKLVAVRAAGELEHMQADELLRESEARVRTKLNAILSPEGDIGLLELSDIIDVSAVRALMEDFYKVSGIGSAILDISGNVLIGIGWQDICTKFHRINPQMSQNCIESDTALSQGVELGTFKFYRCRNNMWDVVTPIMVGDRHVGNLFTGQFFFEDEEINLDMFRAQASSHGLDEAAYLAALERVPRFSRDRINSAMSFFMKLAQTISQLSYSSIKLARSAAMLTSSSERLDLALSGGDLGLWDWEVPLGKITRDERWCAMLGYSLAELELDPMPWQTLVHPDDLAQVHAALEQHLSGETPAYEAEYRMRHKDGHWVWILNRGKVVERNAVGAPLRAVGTHMDITERKLIEQQLQDHQEHLEELVKQRTNELSVALEEAKLAERAKDSFLANVSHELRTPLNAVIGLADLVRRTSQDAKQREYLDKITDAGNTLAHIINDLLDLSKIAAGRMELEFIYFSLHQLLQRCNSTMSHKAAEKGLQLIERINDDVPDVLLGDPHRLEQILLNLLSNAIKFTKAGRVEIRVSMYDCEQDRVCLNIKVEDTGIGMRADDIEKLFKPFSQTDVSMTRRYGGTGLGLALCKQLAQMMGGDITVTSSEGSGTTFRILLWFGIGKADDLPEAKTVVDMKEALPVRYMNARVLVVDDQPLNREIVEALLTSVDIKVRVATNGSEAVGILATAGPDAFDLILMDVQMPIMDGLTATREIRSWSGFKRVKIIAMTAHTMEHEKQGSIEAGMNDHIGKPFEGKVFYRMLAKWIPRSKQQRPEARPPGEVEITSPGDSGLQPPIPVRMPEPLDAVHSTDGKPRSGHVEAQGLSALSNVDTQGAVARFAGNESRYRHWLTSFLEEGPTAVTQIRQALAVQQMESARKLAHALKGRVGMLGLRGLHVIASSFEAALKAGAPADDLFDRLQQAVDAMCGEIKQAFCLTGVDPESGAPDATLPEGELPESVARLIGMLEAADGNSAAAIDRCLAELGETAWAPRLQRALNYAQRFDFDGARRLLVGDRT